MEPDWKDLEAIKRCKYKYMRCLDQKLWDQVGDCFVADATASYSGGKWSYEGREAIVGFLSESMGSEQFLSSHRVHHPEIDFTSPTRARATWALEDTVIDLRFGVTIQGAAFYEDEFEKCGDGQWRLRHTGYLRTYEEIFSRASIAGLKLTASYWDTGGRSQLDAG
jgi:hypothetical protein